MDQTLKVEIDFFGGTHGHFLEYCINSMADDRNKNINPFTKHGGSHNFFYKTVAVADHYTFLKKQHLLKTGGVISIRAKKEDCLLISMLCMARGGDHGLDLKNLEKNLYNSIKNTPFDITENLKNSYNIDISKSNSISRGILREYFKFSFKDYNSNYMLTEIEKQKYNNSIKVYDLYFRDVYCYDKLLRHLININDMFNLNAIPTLDIKIWQEFMDKNKFIELENDTYCILTAINKKQHRKINFNLIQESWLNAQLENLYGKEMPLKQERYFSSTKEIIEYLEL